MRKFVSANRSSKRSTSSAFQIEDLEGRRLLARAIGIDVSEHQGTINWTSVKNAGINFAFVRATYGMTSDDATITANAPNAVNAGVLTGFYHYAYYNLSGHTAQVEADNFWNTTKNYYKSNGKYLMPVLDIEEGSAVYDGSSLSTWVTNWCTIVKNYASAAGLRVVPLVYTSSSPAGSWFTSALPKTVPLWVANYTGTTTPQTSQPTAGTGIWQDWQFWQYTSTGSVSGISGNVDRDVLNGDTEGLKDYIVSSTANAPNGRWVQNQTLQTTSGVNAYATLADAQAQNSNFTAVANGSVGTNISTGPSYGGSYQRWKVDFKNGVTGWVAEDFMQTAAAPAASTLSSPANNAHLTVKPLSLTWTASALATSYDVYLDGVLKENTEALSSTIGTLADGTHTWQARAKNSQGTATGSTFTFILDTVAPSVSLAVQSPAGGASTFDFTVNYSDATAGVDASTIGAGDVTVTGPNGSSQAASFVSYNSSNGVATYRINAPGGTWNADDNGTYTVSQNASQVKDLFGNTRAAGSIGTFAANTFAYLSGATLVLDYGSTSSSAMTFLVSGANLVVQKNGGNASFPAAGVSSVLISGSFGSDTLNVASGALAFASDLSATSPNLSINVSTGASVAFSSVQHLAALTIAGGAVNIASGKSNTLVVNALSITNSGKLDLTDNSLIVDYAQGAQSPAATVEALIATGYNAGNWQGNGVTSSNAADPSTNGIYTLGIVDNAAMTNAFTSFGGQTVDTSSVLVRFTYRSDRNLDGAININDSFSFNGSYNEAASSFNWLAGDLNFDGICSINDSFLFNGSYNESLPPL